MRARHATRWLSLLTTLSIGLDIDAPDDLALLLTRGPDTRSAGLLRSLGVPARLAAHRGGA